MRRAAKLDETHAEIADALANAGVELFSLAPLGRGVPDLCGSFGGFTALIECKARRGQLNDQQRAFADRWKGRLIVARTGEEAVRKFFQAYGIGVLRGIGKH